MMDFLDVLMSVLTFILAMIQRGIVFGLRVLWEYVSEFIQRKFEERTVDAWLVWRQSMIDRFEANLVGFAIALGVMLFTLWLVSKVIRWLTK